jgi:hypothetical protein
MDISVGCPVSLKQEWPLRVKQLKSGLAKNLSAAAERDSE